MDENEPLTDTGIISAAALELVMHLTALRRGEPLAAMHEAQAFECLDLLAESIR